MVWDDRCQQPFDDLKCLCTMATFPPMWISPGLLNSISMRAGLVWGLCSISHIDGMDTVIAYTSRSLTKTKSNYPAHKLEFITLKWAVVKKFYEYLYRLIFDVHIDDNPLTYVLTIAKLDAASH